MPPLSRAVPSCHYVALQHAPAARGAAMFWAGLVAAAHSGALLAAIAVHYRLAMAMTAVIAYVIHRGGLIGGILGGAVLGLSFYFINYYTLSYFYPQFFAMKHWSVLASHVLFGALAGGVYELLEDQIFEADFAPAGGH